MIMVLLFMQKITLKVALTIMEYILILILTLEIIHDSTDLIKIDKENNTIIINSFINSNYNSKLEISNLIVGIYLRIYQTDNNDNIKTYTAQKAMEIFKTKTNSGSGIFISIFDDKNMLSAYWHPLRKHCGIVGEIVKSVKNYIKIVESEPGYWAIAIHHRIENGHTFYNTIKE
ncbi:hypothetical protein LY90DRAFT_512940 [Neocallimastix californiae]|uniref:Uncharacterized protein n=1 Tax=Neocallimastix californiae TaxID=1754190 RepID=A0A1Y2B310_9FUNG|nr:hypothetical protein LY90DRAFT_512940 [Neocallimastix californiae]|eukprot:ORY29212.1 hypothetical protein LY90DRAFT_512940 [Neocallimastix californiae]